VADLLADEVPVPRLRGRASDGAATRRAILTAAATLFSERGYAGASLSDIVAATGLTKGALYWHFASKEEIALSVVRQTFRDWPAVIDETLVAHDDVLDTLVALSRRIADQFVCDPVVQATKRLMAELPATALAQLPRPYVGWERTVAALVARGQAEGRINAAVDPAVAARVVVASFFGMQQISLELSARKDLHSRVDEFWELLRPALEAPAPTDGPMASTAPRSVTAVP
jgi:AcrR family transcriptional regulator